MFKITAQQMNALAEHSLAQFELRLIEMLAEQFPESQDVPINERRHFVREQITRARQYGFETEQDFAIYVMAAWVLGGEFDRDYRPARFVLRSKGYDRDEKREWLLHWSYEIFSAGAQAAGMGDGLKPLSEWKI